ncbi:hypothetical protein NLU13_6071 [Sarocladium strictum]|uniref:Uncharacterized protein n=1 Tax=Sarocladium strictum TaxID=5046 RepID=A0AA39GFX6_SARSR|nr:hypothetical protein NLU13_6071 [Sarocladium strictum]
MSSISGQSVLILGGSSGMGFGIAKLCLGDHIRVAIASSSQAKVDNALRRLTKIHPNAKSLLNGYVIDLDSDDVETEMERILSDVTKHGTVPLDHIVYTAGRPDMHAISDIDLMSLFKSAQLPLFVPFLLGKLAPKYLREGRSSSLIFTSGQVAERPVPGFSIPAAYATGLQGLTRNLACELAPRRVNCVVAPGSSATEPWGDRAESMRDTAAEKSPLGKPPASVEDVAEAFAYLMRNTDATGSIVSTNSGSVLK